MLLKYLILNDFRQFKDRQFINFSTDPIKNVSIIMGGNGFGKTCLAQAFTWCLYGETSFSDQVLLCKKTAEEMTLGGEKEVCVELCLKQSDKEYLCVRKQIYAKGNDGNLKPKGSNIFEISYKDKDGQTIFIEGAFKVNLCRDEILPRALSKYFFFDGERIKNMSDEIHDGKSQEFAQAVEGFLGLGAIKSALNHLNGKHSKNSLMALYNKSYDSKNNSKIEEYNKSIDGLESDIENNENKVKENKKSMSDAQDMITRYEDKIRKNEESTDLAAELEKYNKQMDNNIAYKREFVNEYIDKFSKKSLDFFARKLINDSLAFLNEQKIIDKGVPYINEKTIKFLIDRGECICGAKILNGNNAYDKLLELKKYIPPQSLGTMVSQFITECQSRVKNSENYYKDISKNFEQIERFENNENELKSNIAEIENKLSTMEHVGELQAERIKYVNEYDRLNDENESILKEIGSLDQKKSILEADRKKLSLKDKNNKKIENYKSCVGYIYDKLLKKYQDEERIVRDKLQSVVNEIFKSIYDGGFSLEINDKYNIQIQADGYNGLDKKVETSTAQSMSVIFAFISGVIKIARENNNKSENNRMLVTDPYPLVMDAPLSFFDKERIKTVCNSLPQTAEQVIIFIKDTDGEIAEEYLKDKIGKKYSLKKIDEFETRIKEG